MLHSKPTKKVLYSINSLKSHAIEVNNKYFFQLGSVGLAYQRFKAGSDTAFSQGLGDETMGQDGSQYQGYQEEAGYSEAPFQGGGQQGRLAGFCKFASRETINNQKQSFLY